MKVLEINFSEIGSKQLPKNWHYRYL